MAKIDEIRNKLGVKKLEDGKQADLYKGFQKAGGKVVQLGEEDEVKKNLNALSKKIANQKEDERLTKEQAEALKRKQARAAASRHGSDASVLPDYGKGEKKQGGQKEKKEKNPFWDLVRAKFAGSMAGVMHLFSNRFTDSFYDQTLIDLRGALSNSRKILVSVLHQDKEVTAQLKEALAAVANEFGFELVYRFDLIYDDAIFNKITEHRNASKQIIRSQASFMKLFKKLFILKNITPTLSETLRTLLSNEAQIRGINMDITEANIKLLDSHIDMIFKRYYPKLLLVMDYYFQLQQYSGAKETWANFIKLDNPDKVGYWTAIWKEEEEKEARRKKEEEERRKKEEEKKPWDKDDSEMNQYLRDGLKLIFEKVDFGKILHEYQEKKDPWGFCTLNERGFLIFALMDVFDKNFSFLFASTNVHYDIFVDQKGVKYDIKKTFRDIYFQLEGIYQRCRNYAKTAAQIVNGMKRNTGLTNFYETPELKRLTTYAEETLRLMILDSRKYLEQFTKVFDVIMQSERNFRQAVRNPDDVLGKEFKASDLIPSSDISIYEVFRITYRFLLAFHYHVMEGDLGSYNRFIKKPQFLNIPSEEEVKVLEKAGIPATATDKSDSEKASADLKQAVSKVEDFKQAEEAKQVNLNPDNPVVADNQTEIPLEPQEK